MASDVTFPSIVRLLKSRCASRGVIPGFGEQCLLVFKNKELKGEEEAKKR